MARISGRADTTIGARSLTAGPGVQRGPRWPTRERRMGGNRQDTERASLPGDHPPSEASCGASARMVCVSRSAIVCACSSPSSASASEALRVSLP
jgi:hypothetical protein